MQIKYLNSKEELLSIYSLIRLHHTAMKDEDFAQFIDEMKNTNYQCIAAYDEGKLVATVGFWIGVRFYCGKYMYVNNFVVDPSLRGRGVGSDVMKWLEDEALRLGCKTGVSRMGWGDVVE